MPYLLITGIVFVAIPSFMMVGVAAVIFINFMRDDRDMKSLLNFALMSVVFGLMLIAGHYVGISV